MNNKNEKRLEKEQQLLIDRILKRKDIEHEALLKVARKSIKNPDLNVKEEKEKLVKQRMQMEEEVDEELLKDIIVEELAEQKRKEEVEKIIKELRESERIREERRKERIYNDRLRAKQSIKEAKRLDFLRQVAELDKKEESTRREFLEQKAIETIQETRKNLDISERTAKEKPSTDDRKIKNTPKKEKSSYKWSHAMEQYQKTIQNIEEYGSLIKRFKNRRSKSKEASSARNTRTIIPRTKKEARKSFAEVLSSVINHQKANEEYMNKSKEAGKSKIDNRMH